MIRVLLADDQLLILEYIKVILEQESEIEIVGTARNGRDAIFLVKTLRPDILLIDIEMPEMDGITATKYVRKYLSDTKIIVLTSYSDQDYLAEALLAGASGYLLKDSLIKDLRQAIYSFGVSYSDTKARLLSKVVKKNSQTKVVRYREKIIYLNKYRKNIYKPAVDRKKQQLLDKIPNTRLANPGIGKASLARISKLTTKKNLATDLETYSLISIYSSQRFNYRKYLRRVIWLLLLFLSILLSIIIF